MSLMHNFEFGPDSFRVRTERSIVGRNRFELQEVLSGFQFKSEQEEKTWRRGRGRGGGGALQHLCPRSSGGGGEPGPPDPD